MYACTCYVYAGELDKIEIDTSNFDDGSVNVLVISFTTNGQTGQRTITFLGECASMHAGMDIHQLSSTKMIAI